MSLFATLNRVLFRRTSTFAITVMGSVFFFERTFDILSETIFESYNKGKLWKDVEKKLAEGQ